jgi:hypothetical protein
VSQILFEVVQLHSRENPSLPFQEQLQQLCQLKLYGHLEIYTIQTLRMGYQLFCTTFYGSRALVRSVKNPTVAGWALQNA